MRIIVDNNVHITLARSAQTHCKEHERNAQPCQRSFTRTRFTYRHRRRRRSSLLRNYFMMCINAADKWQIDVADTITFLLVFFSSPRHRYAFLSSPAHAIGGRSITFSVGAHCTTRLI